jgi:CubicO group peptidase (beta-lactamase class C family)
MSFLLACLVSQATIQRAAPQSSSPKSIGVVVESVIKDSTSPGIAVIIQHRGKVIYKSAKGFANLETRSPMTLDSVHELASVSKQFTATATMLLVQQGALKLSNPLSMFVDDAPKAWSQVTVQNLLEHSSGLPDYLGYDADLSKEISTQELLKQITAKNLSFEPGSKWEYSNSGYMALGHIIAKASKKEFGDFVTTNVFKPAGMKTAVIANPSAIIPNRASGYHKVDNKWINETYVSPSYSNLGDGMVCASANDLLAWHRALMARKILDEKTWVQLWQPSAPSSKTKQNYGFGFGIPRTGDKPRLAHSGGWIGTTTFLLSDLETDSCIIILTNTDSVRHEEIMKSALALINSK